MAEVLKVKDSAIVSLEISVSLIDSFEYLQLFNLLLTNGALVTWFLGHCFLSITCFDLLELSFAVNQIFIIEVAIITCEVSTLFLNTGIG